MPDILPGEYEAKNWVRFIAPFFIFSGLVASFCNFKQWTEGRAVSGEPIPTRFDDNSGARRKPEEKRARR
jgi:hypothetical protein